MSKEDEVLGSASALRADVAPVTSTTAHRPLFADDIKDWEHLDGTVCNAGFLAPTPTPPTDGARWWCTEHQQTLFAREVS